MDQRGPRATASQVSLLPDGGSGRIDVLRTEPAAGVDAFLESWIASLSLPSDLHEAITYAVLGGGKRLRPILCWHCAIAAHAAHRGARDAAAGHRAVPAGAAIELIHAFSLVHDDLPAMDDDATRRGRPTLHVHAGEAMAILAGDAMLAMAFDAISAEPPRGEPYNAALRSALLHELTAGSVGMIVGQVHDTFRRFPQELTDLERVERTHRCKTGALLRTSCRSGALVGTDGDVEAPVVASLSDYAECIGLMFQIVDDLMDVEQPAEAIGKATNKDAEAGKLTYPSVLGVEGSRRRVDELATQAATALEPLGGAGDDLRLLCDFLARRSA